MPAGSGGQLEQEMRRHGWFVTPGEEALLYDCDVDTRWASAFQLGRGRSPPAHRGVRHRISSLEIRSSLLTLTVETPATTLMRPSSRIEAHNAPDRVESGDIMSGQLKGRGLFASAALLLCVSTPAQAAMGCWNETQVAAAKVRDLQSRLMVATLRCQAMGRERRRRL